MFVALLYPHGQYGHGQYGQYGQSRLEHFGVPLSSATVGTRDTRAFCRLTREFPAAFADSKDMLNYRTCIGVADPDADYLERLRDYFSMVAYYVDEIDVRSNAFGDVTSRIQQSVRQVHMANRETKVEGPVYALVFQAPYFRDMRRDIPATGRVVHMQPFNVAEFKYMSTGIIHDAGDDIFDNKPGEGVAVKIFLLYPLYDKSMRPRFIDAPLKEEAIRTCMDYFLNQTTTENLCRIQCLDNAKFTCGCANRKESSGAGYASVCLGPKDKDDRQKIEKVTYGSVYRVNEETDALLGMFVHPGAHKDGCTTTAATNRVAVA